MSCYLLGLGANLGKAQKNLNQTIAALSSHQEISLSVCSSVYLSAALTHPDNQEPQPDFYNMVIAIDCLWHPEKLLSLIHLIEYQHGRRRQNLWQARSIDIDILLYSNMRYSSNRLSIPHPQMYKRDFVIRPLREIQEKLPAKISSLCPTENRPLYPLCHKVADMPN